MNDIERKARALLAYECPECGGDNSHETEDGWLHCSRCSNPYDVTRHQAMQAIIAALTPPEGYFLIPVDLAESSMQLLYSASNGKENIFADTAGEIREFLASRQEVSP